MFYKKNRYKDWVFWLDWIMVFLFLFMGYDAIFVVGLDVWKWGLINFELGVLLVLIIGYITFRNQINQNRMYEILKEDSA